MHDIVILRPEDTDIRIEKTEFPKDDINSLWHELSLALDKARETFMREAIRSLKLTVEDLDKLVLVQLDSELDIAYETETGVQIMAPVTFELRLKEKNDAH